VYICIYHSESQGREAKRPPPGVNLHAIRMQVPSSNQAKMRSTSLLASFPVFFTQTVSIAVPQDGAGPLLRKRSVTCLTVGATATATWVNSASETCTFVGVVGGNYGTNSEGDGEYAQPCLETFKYDFGATEVDERRSYSCSGRCGAGCTGTAVGNVYTQDCFSHDICSYFNDATGGARLVPAKRDLILKGHFR
jgi:hypothetical protein